MKIIAGDCLQVLPTLEAESVDSCVTDPPYELGFMGRKWDGTGIAFRPDVWREVWRVLKPGGYLLAFGGTRGFHRMFCAIEDAGFEVRDCIMWMYGSGFPKSHDVSKAIDKAAGVERELTRPGSVKRDGYGDDWDTGSSTDRPRYDNPATEAARDWQGWGTALKPAYEPICVARKPLVGTVAQNVQQYGTGALNIDACRVESERATGWSGGASALYDGRLSRTGGDARPVEGRWPANVIHDGSDEVLAAFPYQKSGNLKPSHNVKESSGWSGGSQPDRVKREFDSSEGSAARFFYTSKADKSDRLGSKHPTVKPVDLMAYLCRLVTQPGGTVLDPFAGSGSTGMACLREGFNAVLIEREAEYVADINRRFAHVKGEDAPLFAEAT